MAAEGDEEVPEGAAVFPTIPADLGVDPLLLAVVHATVFLAGSDESLLHPGAAEEAVQCMAAYMGRLHGDALRRIREDMECLVRYSRQQGWSKQLVRSLKTFLADYGVEEESDA